MSLRILVTGAKGQLGQTLLVKGPKFGFEILGCSRHELDITDTVSIALVMQKLKPDLIINTAAYTSVDKAETEVEETFKVNEHGAANLARACKKDGIPLFHISTDYVFDGQKSTPYIESDPVNPIKVYGASKEAGEQAIRDIIDEHIILRTSWVFSKIGSNFANTILRLANEHDTLNVVSDQFGGPTSAIGIAECLLCIATCGFANWGTYHFAGTPSISRYEFAQFIVEEARKVGVVKNNVKVKPKKTVKVHKLAPRPSYSYISSNKYQLAFGSPPDDWQYRVIEMLRS